MSNYVVRPNVEVENWEEVCREIAKCVGSNNIDPEQVKSFIENETATCYFLDAKLNQVEQTSPTSVYAWIDTGYVAKQGQPVFVSLLNYGGWGFYTGDKVAAEDQLVKSAQNHFPENKKYIRINASKFMNAYRTDVMRRKIKHLEPKKAANVNSDDSRGQKIESDIAKKIRMAGFCDVPEAPGANKKVVSDEVPETKADDKTSVSNVGTGQRVYREDKVENLSTGINGRDVYCEDGIADVTSEIYSDLLFPNWNSIHGLDRYLKVIGFRVMKLIEEKQTEYYVMNSCGSVVVNTGLMNRYGEDYRVLYRFYIGRQIYDAYQIMHGKVNYIENGFTKEDASADLRPIVFFDDENSVFCPNWEDIDFDAQAMEHIVNERRNRFPEDVRELSDHLIAERVKDALVRGIRMQQRDRNYAKAIYSTQSNGISWLMPLHINTALTEKPELVLVIRRCQEFYQVKTILPYDADMQDRIMAMSLYSKMW